MRLNVFISKCGYTSRRKADILIFDGMVRVNDVKVCKPFIDVTDKDIIKVNGETLCLQKHVYILFNKPKGVTTTLSDRFAEKKIIDFFPEKFKGIFPVGRLDKNSSGLILMTNDGEFCHKVTHPKFLIEKEYLILLEGLLKVDDCLKAKEGVIDNGDNLKVNSIKVIKRNKSETVCEVIVNEGKKRHLRRLFKKLGFEVKELKRVRIASLKLGRLKEGEFKIINSNSLKI